MSSRDHLPKAALGRSCCGGLVEHKPHCHARKYRSGQDEIDPRDAEIAALKARAEKAEAERAYVYRCNEALREPMAALRAAVGMPAEGEGAVVAKVLSERDAAIAACAEMRAALRGDTPYPVPDLLERFAEVADTLLHRHDYDGHGWELIQSAMEHARDAAPRLRAALSRAEVGAVVQAAAMKGGE